METKDIQMNRAEMLELLGTIEPEPEVTIEETDAEEEVIIHAGKEE